MIPTSDLVLLPPLWHFMDQRLVDQALFFPCAVDLLCPEEGSSRAVALQAFIARGVAMPLAAVAAEPDLVRDLQALLVRLGILDPSIDGIFGPVTQWALAGYTEPAPGGEGRLLTSASAQALIDAAARGPVPLDTSAQDLAARVAAAMERRGYWIARAPDCVTIAYLEGVDYVPPGQGGPARATLNRNEPNRFNDLRLVLTVDAAGKPRLLGAWDGTTEPGRYWTEHPMNPEGAARIAFSQRKAWAVGVHHAGQPNAHEALVQVAKITVFRDANRDFKRDGDRIDTGIFAVNQHWGYDRPRDDIGTAGAGCLIGRSRDGHREFMAIVKRDPRFLVNHAYRFLTAVLPGAALDEAAFDPTDPH